MVHYLSLCFKSNVSSHCIDRKNATHFIHIWWIKLDSVINISCFEFDLNKSLISIDAMVGIPYVTKYCAFFWANLSLLLCSLTRTDKDLPVSSVKAFTFAARKIIRTTILPGQEFRLWYQKVSIERAACFMNNGSVQGALQFIIFIISCPVKVHVP